MHKLALAAASIGRRPSSTVPRTTTATMWWGDGSEGFWPKYLADGRRITMCAGTGREDDNRGRHCCFREGSPRVLVCSAQTYD